ncbi:unnamed protein product [Ectocarpus sp. CCAP 1310/34]|nr:unnamed protein product [Ectocarpus sp. CCAP 1310/34]
MSESADLSSSVSPAQSTAVGGGGGEGETETAEGAPAAGGQVGDSGVQESSNDTTIASSSSGGEGVPVKHPADVYTSAGHKAQIAAATVAAVDNFQAPSGFVKKGCRQDSFMYSLGVYVEQIGGDQHKFFCLAGPDCRRKKKVIPCRRGDRSNVNSHLKSVHGMQGKGGVTKQARRQSTQQSIGRSLTLSKNSQLGKNRVRELLCTKWLVERFLAFNFFSASDMWRQTIGFETAENTPYPPLPPERMKHLVAEMFLATKKVLETRWSAAAVRPSRRTDGQSLHTKGERSLHSPDQIQM